MTYHCDPSRDLPVAWKPKRVIVYRQGLKIYGCLPYILARRLDAEFISNNASALGARIVAPTMEDNYTLVRYRRRDGRPHRREAVQALLDWLYADRGFEWAVAAPEFFDDRLDLVNWWQAPPETFVPGSEAAAQQFAGALLAGPDPAPGAAESEAQDD